MMFELYQTDKGSRGSLAEVWIDTDAKLVKKYYKPDGITIRGRRPLHQQMEHISALFNNEIYWSTKLSGKHVLRIYEHGELKTGPGFYILQEYVGPDLLHFYNSKSGLDTSIENPIDQIIEMFSFFRDHGVYKINNAMCNLTNDNGKIRAFDFKYAVHRTPDLRNTEIYGIKTWLSKIDGKLPDLLMEYV